jgi:preprotein translocase subunit SecA
MVSRQKVLTKVLGDPQARTLKSLQRRVKAINSLEDTYKAMNDAELQAQTDVLKQRLLDKGESLDSILPDAFALVREASSRVLGQRHYDVQLFGGLVLHEGNVA